MVDIKEVNLEEAFLSLLLKFVYMFNVMELYKQFARVLAHHDFSLS